MSGWSLDTTAGMGAAGWFSFCLKVLFVWWWLLPFKLVRVTLVAGWIAARWLWDATWIHRRKLWRKVKRAIA